MALLILHPRALPRLAQAVAEEAVEVPKLEATDTRDNYAVSDGDGLWIPAYVCFLERLVRERCGLPGFAFSEDYGLDTDLFEEIPSLKMRALLIEFTNQVYPDWHGDAVDLPDYSEVRESCRGFCADCDSAYEEVHGTYDGPRAEEVEDDEPVDTPGLSCKELHARKLRNAARQAERERRTEAQEAAEAEVIETNWSCEEDCDGFLDDVDEHFRGLIAVDTTALQAHWVAFLAARGEHDFPPLIVELARQRA